MNKMPFEDGPYTQRDMSELYKVSPKVFRRWMSALADQLGKKEGHFFNQRQIDIIKKNLGLPPGFSDAADPKLPAVPADEDVNSSSPEKKSQTSNDPS